MKLSTETDIEFKFLNLGRLVRSRQGWVFIWLEQVRLAWHERDIFMSWVHVRMNFVVSDMSETCEGKGVQFCLTRGSFQPRYRGLSKVLHQDIIDDDRGLQG